MDKEIQIPQPEPKINYIEGILMSLVIFCCALMEELPLIGAIPEVLTTEGYLMFKGLNATAQLVMLGDNVISVIVSTVFPFLGGFIDVAVDLVGFWIVVWIDHHPKLEAVTEIAGGVANLAEGAGKGAVVEGELAAEESEAAAQAARSRAAGSAEEAGEASGGASSQKSNSAARGSREDIDPEAFGQERQLLGDQGQLERELFQTPEDQFKEIGEDAPGARASTEPKENESISRMKKTYQKVQDIRQKTRNDRPSELGGGGQVEPDDSAEDSSKAA